jgi:hypothetical protein
LKAPGRVSQEKLSLTIYADEPAILAVAKKSNSPALQLGCVKQRSRRRKLLGSEIFTQLQEADWAAIAVELTAHAAFRADNLTWRTGNSHNLAKGQNPADIAAEAIRKVIGGIRQ